MSPQQQDRFLDHVEEYEHMPPGARQEARELYRREQSLPASRQQAVHNAVHELDGLSPQERQQRLSSPEFRSRFTDTEREIIGQAVEMEPRPNQPSPNRQPAPPEQR